VRQLIERYAVYFVAPATDFIQTTRWLEQYINVPAWQHTVFIDHRQLLLGDYLIEKAHTKDSMATRLEYGSETFKSWEDLLEYFSRLDGQ
jgi:hypothetical protein